MLLELTTWVGVYADIPPDAANVGMLFELKLTSANIEGKEHSSAKNNDSADAVTAHAYATIEAHIEQKFLHEGPY